MEGDLCFSARLWKSQGPRPFAVEYVLFIFISPVDLKSITTICDSPWEKKDMG